MPRRSRSHQAPKQARSRFLVDAVIEATERIVQDTGWANAKVARIAKVAGVSVGSIYRYFPGREVLLRTLIDRRLEDDRAVFVDALRQLRGPSLRDSLQAFAQALFKDARLTSPVLLRQLVDLLDAAGRLDNVHAMVDGLAGEFAARLLHQHPELGERAWIERRSHMLFWALRAAFVARVRVEDPFDFEAFVTDAVEISEGVLSPSTQPKQPQE